MRFALRNKTKLINAFGEAYYNELIASIDVYKRQAKGVSAPIFVDNAESVNQIIPSLSQIIRLVVTTDKELTIK